MARLLPPQRRQAFVYDRTFRNDIEAVAFPVMDSFGRAPDFQNPKTFTEKLRGLWLTHPNPLMSLVSDKVAVRDYFARFDLPFAPPKLFGVYERPEDLKLDHLPSHCMIKINDGCGMQIPHTPENPVTQERFDAYILDSWRFDHWRRHAELHYRDIPRKLLVEELLTPLEDIQETGIHCLMGEPYKIHNTRRGAVSYFLPDGTYKPRPDGDINPQHGSQKPHPRLKEMLATARLLAAPFACARIDFMHTDDRVFLGEITLSPGGLVRQTGLPSQEPELCKILDLSKLPALVGEGRRICRELGWPVETSFGHFAGDPRLATAGLKI